MGEYFIDEDYQYGTGISFTIDPEAEDIEQAFTAQISASTPLGYHKLYGRVKDTKGNWSHTFRKNIQVYINPITNLVEIEYFFGDDLTFGNNTIITIDEPETDGTWTFNVPYPEGDYSFDDKLFVRVKDSNENWSITTILDEVGSLGIDDYLQKSTLVYPNPVNDELILKLPDNVSIIKTKLYNHLGQAIYSSSEMKSTLGFGNLETGFYVLVLESKSGKAAFKIIKK